MHHLDYATPQLHPFMLMEPQAIQGVDVEEQQWISLMLVVGMR